MVIIVNASVVKTKIASYNKYLTSGEAKGCRKASSLINL